MLYPQFLVVLVFFRKILFVDQAAAYIYSHDCRIDMDSPFRVHDDPAAAIFIRTEKTGGCQLRAIRPASVFIYIILFGRFHTETVYRHRRIPCPILL